MEPYDTAREERPIAVGELDPTAHTALQHDQLVSKCNIFRAKSACRLENAMLAD